MLNNFQLVAVIKQMLQGITTDYANEFINSLSILEHDLLQQITTEDTRENVVQLSELITKWENYQVKELENRLRLDKENRLKCSLEIKNILAKYKFKLEIEQVWITYEECSSYLYLRSLITNIQYSLSDIKVEVN